MHHLITGGSGFLGNLIARRLVARGEQVTVLDVWEDSTRPAEIRYVECDIRDRAGVAAAMRGVDLVHHNVALVPLSKSGRKYWEVNVDGSGIAAEEAGRAGVKAFVHVSSSAVFGTPRDCPVTAATPLAPVEIYGRAKLAGEQVVEQACATRGVPLIIIRPRTILGEGRLGIFQILFDWISRGKAVYTIGSGRVPFQFVHAHDLMDFYMLAIDRGQPGAFNVGTDRYGTLREALEHLIDYAGTGARVRSLPQTLSIQSLRLLDYCGLSPLAPWHYLTYHKAFAFDVAPLQALGWQPCYSNDEMLRESYNWFMAHRADAAKEAGSMHRKPVREGILALVKWLS